MFVMCPYVCSMYTFLFSYSLNACPPFIRAPCVASSVLLSRKEKVKKGENFYFLFRNSFSHFTNEDMKSLKVQMPKGREGGRERERERERERGGEVHTHEHSPFTWSDAALNKNRF